eukprot:1332614-Prymnesium_polylepis.1
MSASPRAHSPFPAVRDTPVAQTRRRSTRRRWLPSRPSRSRRRRARSAACSTATATLEPRRSDCC